MKSNIAFISKDMERDWQYSSALRARNHAKTMIGRNHSVVKTNCYRMAENDVLTFQCYTLVLQK